MGPKSNTLTKGFSLPKKYTSFKNKKIPKKSKVTVNVYDQVRLGS